MAKSKNKLNKTNSSGWLDDYSEELSINQYANGGLLPKAQYGFINPSITLNLVPALYNKFLGKNNPVKANVKNPSKSFVQEIPSTIKPTYELMREDYLQKMRNLKTQLSTNDSTNYNMSNAINLTSGRFKGAAVSPELINEAVQSAKAKGIDPWLMLSVIGRESTFGSGDIANVFRKKSKRDLLSGWNVSEPYEPYDPLRFFADKKAPGISVIKDAHGWFYDVNDETALNKYLTQHPELVAQYQQKISATPLLGDLDSFDLAAKMIKEKGLKNYNAGDPKYLSMVNQDMQLLKSDSKLKEYMKKLGYKNGGEINQYADGGKINAPIYVDNPNDPRLQKYKDSLNLHKYYLLQKSIEGGVSTNSLLGNLLDPPNLKNYSSKYIGSKSNKPISREYMPLKEMADSLIENSDDIFFVNDKDSPDLRHKSIKPINAWWGTGGLNAEWKKPVQPVVLNQNNSTVNATKGKVTGKVIPNNVKGSKLIQVREEINPKNTNFTVPNNGGFSTPEDYVEPVVEQMPIQQPVVQEQVPVKQDFKQYIQPNGFSRKGQSGEIQSESFYDANGKMTGQIIEGQYIPTEYGKFLQSGMTEDEYVNQIQEFAGGGKVNDNNGYLISNLDNFTPKKIINSNYITTNNMAFPVEANGVVLYPNTGDYVFPTDKVTEIPIMQNGSSINNDMKKKLKKYPAGGYLDYQEGFKGFGVGPQLYQDNSYFRSIMPDTIENIEEQINQPSVFSGINDILGSVNQGVNQITGLMSQFSQPTAGASNYIPIEQSVANNFTQDTQGGAAGIMGNAPIIQGIPSNTDINWSTKTPTFMAPKNKNGGYLRKYQNGGEMDMLPVGSPEYIHKSNVFHENYNPVPRVHFTDDTTPFDMGVNLNDLVNMNGGRINKYQNGGDMSLQGYFNYLTSQNQNRVPSRAFNANTNRASLGALESANANDFLNTKMRKDRQSFEDDKIDWGFMNWAKEPVGYSLGVMSTVPIVGDISKSIVGDSFLTRQKGYAIGKGIGNVTGGAAKVIGGAALTAAGMPQGISMIGQGIGDVGEGVGGTVGTLQAKDALSNYDKAGYISGNRMVNASQDFGNMMYSASDLFGNVSGGIGMAKNMGGLKGMTGKMKGGKTGMEGFGNFMQSLSGMGGQGSGGFDFSQLAGLIGQDGGYLNNYQEGGMVSMPEDFEIPKFKKGGLTPKKAREILHDKSVHGNPLTDKQRKYFGYISSQKKSSGGWLDEL